MRIIGVTGGVGAGKSTVLSYLEEKYGARVIQADMVGHEVMEPGNAAHDEILKVFGTGILASDGRIDRKNLGDIVFHEPDKLARLNAIVHPAVKAEILKRLAEYEREGADCAVVEAALFLEENYDAFCHETWYIYADEQCRRARLRKSRGYTDERIDRMFASQRTHEEFLRRCGAVIDNNGAEEDTCRQIDRRMI